MGIINHDTIDFDAVGEYTNTYIRLAQGSSAVVVDKQLDGTYCLYGRFETFVSKPINGAPKRSIESFSLVLPDVSPEAVSDPITLLYNRLKVLTPNYSDA